MKPVCLKCGKKSVVHYIRDKRKWISIGYYCPKCDLVVKPLNSNPPIIHRMDVKEFLNTTTEKFDLILADPPYQYNIEAPREKDRIGNYYEQMSTKDICNLPIQKITQKKAILFLWSPSPKIEEAMKIIQAWNFEYTTQIVWNKKSIGLGHTARQMHEVLLIAKKGNFPTPLYKPPSIFEEKRTDHSKKPEMSYEIIQRMYPDSRKIELFARQVHSGWTGVGFEASEKVSTKTEEKVSTLSEEKISTKQIQS